jgi:hypothetical protein
MNSFFEKIIIIIIQFVNVETNPRLWYYILLKLAQELDPEINQCWEIISFSFYTTCSSSKKFII